MMFWDGMKALVHKLYLEKKNVLSISHLRALKKTSAAQEKDYLPVMVQGECWSQWLESSFAFLNSSFL